MDSFTLTLTIQDTYKKEVDQYIENGEFRQVLLFSVEEHMNWYALNDLSMDDGNDVKKELNENFIKFLIKSFVEKTTGTRARKLTEKNIVELETTFFCDVQMIGWDMTPADKTRYVDFLSKYRTESFIGTGSDTFLKLLKSRKDVLLNKVSAVNPGSSLQSSTINAVGKDVTVPSSSDSGLMKLLFYGGVGVGVVVAIMVLLFVRRKVQKRSINDVTDNNSEFDLSNPDEFPVREVENSEKDLENGDNQNGVLSPLKFGHTHTNSDLTEVSSMWDTTSQKWDRQYFVDLEHIKTPHLAARKKRTGRTTTTARAQNQNTTRQSLTSTPEYGQENSNMRDLPPLFGGEDEEEDDPTLMNPYHANPNPDRNNFGVQQQGHEQINGQGMTANHDNEDNVYTEDPHMIYDNDENSNQNKGNRSKQRKLSRKSGKIRRDENSRYFNKSENESDLDEFQHNVKKSSNLWK